jgi:hypothetical protein
MAMDPQQRRIRILSHCRKALTTIRSFGEYEEMCRVPPDAQCHATEESPLGESWVVQRGNVGELPRFGDPAVVKVADDRLIHTEDCPTPRMPAKS